MSGNEIRDLADLIEHDKTVEFNGKLLEEALSGIEIKDIVNQVKKTIDQDRNDEIAKTGKTSLPELIIESDDSKIVVSTVTTDGKDEIFADVKNGNFEAKDEEWVVAHNNANITVDAGSFVFTKDSSTATDADDADHSSIYAFDNSKANIKSGGTVNAYGNAEVVAVGDPGDNKEEMPQVIAEGDVHIKAINAAVNAKGNSITTGENSFVDASENATVIASGNNSVISATGDANITAEQGVGVGARGNAKVVAETGSSVAVDENATVTAKSGATVIAEGNANIRYEEGTSIHILSDSVHSSKIEKTDEK